TSALIVGTSGTTVTGLNATVTVTASTLVSGTVTSATVTFSGGRSSTDSGLRVSDTYGNSILLTEAGNATATVNSTVGSVTSSPLRFQVGSSVTQTVSAAFPNAYPSNLGNTSVAGLTLATIDVTSLSGANNAVTVANEAISQVSKWQA